MQNEGRGPGRPAVDAALKKRSVTTTLSPDVIAEWRTSGRTIDDIMRAGLAALKKAG